MALLVLKTRGAVDGATKLSLLLEKQHNRGQDGAGVVTLSSCPETGKPAYNEFKSEMGEASIYSSNSER